jgi:ketosteroid isomerase-like protein
MKRIIRLGIGGAFVGVVVTAIAASSPAHAHPSPADDARAVEAVLRGWYDASQRHDSAAYAAPLLPEFFIFEDTTRIERDALVAMVARGFKAGTDRASIRDLHTVVVGDAAWTSFRNDEAFTPNGAAVTPTRRYLETAIFRRVNGQWKLARYHATRINRPAAR